MCGIFGFAAAQERPADEILNGLRDLEYRGYDSWGIVAAVDGGLRVRKETGPIRIDSLGFGATALGIGHTRWATHGGVTQANAHPHLSEDQSVAVVHNGIVENFSALRSKLEAAGHEFASETDSEVIVHLYEEERKNTSDSWAAFQRTWDQLDGLNAVVVLDREARRLLFGRKGSPLAVGRLQDGYALASDGAALAGLAEVVVFLEDGWRGWISGTASLFVDESGQSFTPVWNELAPVEDLGKLDGFAHHMLQEIYQQPAVLRQLAVFEQSHLQQAVKRIRSAKNIFLLGCGTAFHAGLIGEAILRRAGIPARAVLANEAAGFTPFIDHHSLVIVLSQSGETIDVIEPLTQWKKQGATVMAVVNSPFSTLDRMADLSLPLQAGRERAVASTKAFTAKLAVLSLLGAELEGRFPAGKQELLLAAGKAHVWLDSQEDLISDLVRELLQCRDIFFLGRDVFWTLALEAALKVKEISYRHAEGLAAGELKHGTLALAEKDVPFFLLSSAEQEAETISTAMELRARGGQVIGVAPFTSEAFSRHLSLPVEPGLPQWTIVNLIGQELAYRLAVESGLDPDKPRNLAKSVTVK